jgi:hypothetical protein
MRRARRHLGRCRRGGRSRRLGCASGLIYVPVLLVGLQLLLRQCLCFCGSFVPVCTSNVSTESAFNLALGVPVILVPPGVSHVSIAGGAAV